MLPLRRRLKDGPYPAPANSAGRSAGRQCPSAPKTDRQVEGPGEGTARTSARTYLASLRAARLREHARA